MSIERPDDQSPFDESIDRAWRSASGDQPPAHVDAAILAEARRRHRRFSRWQPLAAAASIAGLAFLLVQLMPRERGVEQPIRVERATPPASHTEPAGASPADASAKAERAAEGPQAPQPASATAAAASVEAAQSASTASTPVPAGPAPPTPSPAPPSPATAVAKESVAAPAAEGDLATAEPAGMRANEARAAGSAARDAAIGPQRWTARIESLHAAGKLDDAANALREFRGAYADADRYLPEELRAWASSVR